MALHDRHADPALGRQGSRRALADAGPKDGAENLKFFGAMTDSMRVAQPVALDNRGLPNITTASGTTSGCRAWRRMTKADATFAEP